MRKRLAYKFAAFVTLVAAAPASAADLEIDRRVPEEYETTGGHSLALGNSGVSAQTGIAAVKLNPGLLAIEKEYSVAAGYNWPSAGREFFQAGVLDSKSADIAAGFLYTGFGEDYGEDPTVSGKDKDARTKRRATLALAKVLKNVSLGISGQFVEAIDDPVTGTEVKGTTLGFGVAGFFTPQLRFGASVENLANKKVSEYAPRMLRFGVSYLHGGAIVASFDVRQRERIIQMEQGFGSTGVETGLTKAEREEKAQQEQQLDDKYKDPEWMSFASVSATVYDMIRLLGAYGQSIGGPERKSLSGGIAVGSNNFSLSYSASRPYLTEPEAQQAINATINISL
jgi:hypothetical protein